ncbi:MAG: hypothetical protein V3U15_04900 [Nitrospinota bacterium]
MSIIKKIPLNSPKDERGFSWFPFNDFPQLKKKELLNFHVAELKPGVVRGNHYHPHLFLMALEYEILMMKEDLRLGFISKNEA